MRRVELRHLRYFVAVAETLNLSKASAKLRVAQPALSRQIRDVEEELGVTLLERGPRGVRLTPAGQKLSEEARALLERAGQAMDAVRAAAQATLEEIHVGYAPSPTVELLPRALHAFQNEAPDVRVSLHDLSTEEMLRGLRDRNLDHALLVRPCAKDLRGFVFEELVRYPIRVALGLRHPLTRTRGALTLAQLSGERLHAYSQAEYPEYHEWLHSLVASSGQRLLLAAEHDSATSLIAAIESGRGIALVPSCLGCLAGPRLRLLELQPEPAPLAVGAAYAKAKLSSAAAQFLATLRALKF